MREQPVMLKVLLREKHWQNYSTFCAEYDKAAQRVDADNSPVATPAAPSSTDG